MIPADGVEDDHIRKVKALFSKKRRRFKRRAEFVGKPLNEHIGPIMTKDQFTTILEQNDMSIEDLQKCFESMTAEDFDQLDEDEQDLLANWFHLSEDDLSETEIGQIFAEQEEQEEQPSLNESVISLSLQGNVVDAQNAFDAALEQRITSKLDERFEEMRGVFFEEPIVEGFTFADVLSESDLTIDDMVTVLETMSEEEFDQLDEDEQNIVAFFSKLYEEADGNQELLEAAISQNLLSELSPDTLHSYQQKSQQSYHSNQQDRKAHSMAMAKQGATVGQAADSAQTSIHDKNINKRTVGQWAAKRALARQGASSV